MREVKDGKITEVLDSYLDGSLTSSLDRAIRSLTDLRVRHAAKYTNLRINDSPNEYDEGSHLELHGDRPATIKEQQLWDQELAQRKKRQDKWDREQFEVLKAKFKE